jgi:serine/threonine protein kinase
MRLSRSEEIGRFELDGLLGEGADLQVFAATDTESGEPVVVKRPHPTLVSRNMHGDVEKRTLLQADIRTRIGDMAGLVKLHRLTERDSFGWYFGDDLDNPYSVQVEERAKGLPLVGGVSDLVRGHPVGLPLNLFVLHPSREYIGRGYSNPALSAVGIIGRFYEEGYLAQDLGPQNVFFSPASGTSRVIDLGTLREPSVATARRPAFDLNDILFDVFRLYTTPEDPLREPERFAQTREFRLSGTLERKTETLSKEYAMADARRADSALKILSAVGRREYDSPARFKADFRDYLAEAESVKRDADAEEAWRAELRELRSPYWKKYLFDADTELRGLV